jgi:4-hydroxy 2-oxovalerate aldolase
MTKILDCTLRDGGYYTAWDFDKQVVDEYVKATNILPIDYIELGYRNNPSKNYLGKYGYCPVYELEDIKNKSSKKLAVMLNEKDVKSSDLTLLLDPIKGLVDMIRVAIDPKNFDRAVILAEEIKKRSFEIGFNTMYMSNWKEYEGFFNKLKNINGLADIFCMVDSYGSVSPKDVKETLEIAKENTSCAIGFHGHNNLEMGLINTLTAIDNGVDCVDATILGMGRGAGNLKMELFLTYLNKSYNLDVDFNVLGDVIIAFSGLLQKYGWGTNLPYMISGANSLPQKDVMDWVSNRLYSFNNIVRALDNKKEKVVDNAKYPLLKTDKFDKVIIIGGGSNVISHLDAIKAFIKKHSSLALIHATARNAVYYQDLNVPQYYCLVGSEGKRIRKVNSQIDFKGVCVLPPYPRIMGTDVPSFVNDTTFELASIDFTKNYLDSCTTIALQTAILLSANEIYIIGYDGYPNNILSEKEMALTNENRTLFADFKKFFGKTLLSLTPSLYKELEIVSVYQYI